MLTIARGYTSRWGKKEKGRKKKKVVSLRFCSDKFQELLFELAGSVACKPVVLARAAEKFG